MHDFRERVVNAWTNISFEQFSGLDAHADSRAAGAGTGHHPWQDDPQGCCLSGNHRKRLTCAYPGWTGAPRDPALVGWSAHRNKDPTEATIPHGYENLRGQNIEARIAANDSEYSNHKKRSENGVCPAQDALNIAFTSSKEQRNSANVNVRNVTLLTFLASRFCFKRASSHEGSSHKRSNGASST